MFLDNDLRLSSLQAVTVTANTTNALDMGSSGWTKGKQMAVVFHVEETFTADGSATLTIALYLHSAADAVTSGTKIYDSGAIAKATLVEGYRITVPLSPDVSGRYIEGKYTVATGPMTAGKISAHVTPLEAIQTNR